MPVIDFQSPQRIPPPTLFPAVAAAVRELLHLPEDRVWLVWHHIDEGGYFRKHWTSGEGNQCPIVRVRCKIEYTDEQVEALITTLAELLCEHCDVNLDSVYIVVDPVMKNRLFVRGAIWT